MIIGKSRTLCFHSRQKKSLQVGTIEAKTDVREELKLVQNRKEHEGFPPKGIVVIEIA